MRHACRLALSLCLLPACSIFAVAQSWQSPMLYPSGNDAPSRIATADLLGTQSSDVLAVTAAHDLVLYANDEAGRLSSSPQTLRENVTAIAAAKFSGTTMDDLVVISSATPTAPLQLTLLSSQGGRVFGTAVAIAPQLALGATCQLNAADFDGDGVPDVLIFCPGSNSLVIGINNGKSGFTFTSVPGFLESGRQIQNVSAGDLDGDGLADIVVQSSPIYSPADSRIDVLWGSADGTFSPQLNYVSQPDVTALYIANVDGHPSASLVTDSSNSVSVFANQANRNALMQSTALQVSAGCNIVAIASGRIVNIKYSLGQDMIAAATCNGHNDLLVDLNSAQVATTLSPRLDLSSGTPVVEIHAEVSSAQGSTIPTGQMTLNANGNPVNETLTNGSADFTFHGAPGNNLFTVTYAGDPNTAGAKQYASVVLAGDAAGTNSGSEPQMSIPVSRAPVNHVSNSHVRTMMRVSLPAGTESLHLPAPATPISADPVPTAGDTGSSTASSYTLSVPSVPGSTSGLSANTAYTVVSSVAAPSGGPVATQNGFPVSVSFQINSTTLGQGTASAPAADLSSWSQSSCTWTGLAWTGSCAPDGSGSYPVSIEQDVVTYSSPLTFPTSGTYQVAAIMTPTENGAPTQTQIANLSVNDGPVFSRSTLRPMASGSTGATCSPASFSYGTGATCTITTSCSLNSGDGSYTITSNPAGFSTSGTLITGRATTSITVPVGTYTTTITEITSCGTTTVPGPSLSVSKATPSVVLSSSNPNITYGQSVTFSATAQPVGIGTYPTGSITFYVSGTSIGTVATSNGSASISTSTLAAGSYTVTASYSGDSNYTGATSGGVTQTVSKATPSLSVSCSPNPITYGSQTTDCTSSIGGGTTGSETWTINGGGWITTGLNGSAGGFAGYSAGTYTIAVAYSGDGNNNPVNSSTTLTISKATPSISVSCSPNPITYGSQNTTCTASVSGGATGTVAFTSNGGAWTTVGLSGGTASATGFSGWNADTYPVEAAYSGDSNFNTASSSTSIAIQKAASSISFATSATTVIVGQSIGVSASVCCSQNGTVQFYDSTWNYANVATFGSGASSTFSASTPGTYQLYASWPSNTNYNAATSTPINVTFVMANSSVSLACTPNPADLGQAVSCTATVSGGANGESVDFLDGATQIGVGTISSAVATFSTTSLAVGTHSLTAEYVGDGTYNPSTSNAVSESIDNPGTVTDVSSSLNPSTYGQSVTFSALVNTGGTAPTGNVTFENGGVSIGSGSVSTVSTTNLFVESVDISNSAWSGLLEGFAVAGNAGSAPDGSNTATGLTVNGTDPYTGQIISTGNLSSRTFTESIWVKASGSIIGLPGELFLYGNTFDSVQSCTYGPLTNAWTRISCTVTFPTAMVSTSLAARFDFPAQADQTNDIGDTVLVWGPQLEESSTVGPYIATNGSAASGSGGLATFTTSSLPPGSDPITAVYGGDTNDAASTSAPLTQTVTAVAPTLSVATSGSPSISGAFVTFTATISSGPTGTITFYDGGTPIGTGPISGTTATFTTSSLAVGTHSITAGWAGNADYSAVTSSAISQVVNSGSQTIGFAPLASPVTYGVAPIALSATATSGLPVSFSVLSGPGTVSGSTLTVTGAGTVVVAANQAGNAEYSAAPQVTQTVVVNKATPTISWAPPAAITYGTALSGTQLNATSGGVAGTFAYSPAAGTVLGAGTQTLSVTFTPTDSTNYNSASDTTSLTVNKATGVFTITSSANPSVYGAAVSITVSGQAAATGTITLLDGANPIGTGTLSNGVATIRVPLFLAGPHSLTASYPGDANFLPSTSAPYTQTVNTAAVVISIASTVNPSIYGETVTFTFTFKGVTGGAVPTGSAVVTDGVNNLGTLTLNSSGVATFTTSALVAGTHSITAAYQGDSNYH